MVYTTPIRAAEFKSAYGPKYVPIKPNDLDFDEYQYQANFKGVNGTTLLRAGVRSASFGGAAAVGVLLYVSGIPRVQTDILQKVPFIGSYFIPAEKHPQDNPF